MEGKNNYPDELRVLGATGLLLCSLKYAKVDERERRKLASLVAKRPASTNKQQRVAKVINGNGNLALPSLYEVALPPWNPPEIPPVSRLCGLIGRCSKPYEKQLTESDVKDDQSRLSINKDYSNNCLRPLLNPDENLVEGILVKVYDFEGKEFEMTFKLWAGKYHVLTTGWKAFYKQHDLHSHEDFVTIWMFRHASTGNLCFAITSRRLPIHYALKRIRLT